MVPESERVVERHELGRDANCMVFELAVCKIFIFWKVWRSTLAPVSQSISKKYRKKNPNFWSQIFRSKNWCYSLKLIEKLKLAKAIPCITP